MQFPNKETRAPRPGIGDHGSQWRSSRGRGLCWRQDLRDGDSHQSSQASRTGKDSCSQLQLLYKQHWSEEKRGQEKGEEMDGGEAGGDHPTLPFPPSAFQGAAMLGNCTSHPQRDQTRIVSSLINSGPQLLCVLIYLHTIPVSRGSADRIGSQERAGGRGALRAGFHPPSVALNR